MPDRAFGFDTLCLHAGQIPDAQTGARALPIYQTTSFVFDSADHAASLFNLQTFGNVYTRLSNPTTAVFEERMAALEGGRAAVATASGQAAEMVAFLNLLERGDHVVSSSKLYGGTYTMLAVNFAKLGIEATLVDPDEPGNFRKALKPNTKAIFSETLGNPAINVIDIAAIGAIAREAGVPFIVDNTAASPYLCQPLLHGADIVVHSATKFIGGHGTSMGGVVVEVGGADEFVGLCRVVQRLELTPGGRGGADQRDSRHPIDLRLLRGCPLAVHRVDRRGEQARGAADEVPERLLNRRELPAGVLVGFRQDRVQPDHHVRLVERVGRLEV